jgi:hypothetical protein
VGIQDKGNRKFERTFIKSRTQKPGDGYNDTSEM